MKDDMSERLVLVDENDREIGVVLRGEAHRSTKKIHREIGVVVVGEVVYGVCWSCASW